MRLGKAILAAVLAAGTSWAFADELIDRAKQHLRDRQPKQAYELLLPQEPARAGDPEFDYLLGISALDSGEPERAVFALERVLAVQPANHVARAEIARAYLALGEREAARREFETVRRQQIPEDAKATVDRYLSAIAAADVTQISGYIEAGVGYDTNTNSATSTSQIALPGLGIIATLTPGSTSQADMFGSLAGGINVTRKLSPAWAIVGAASASGKFNQDDTQFDTLNLDGSVGARWIRAKEAITVGAQAQNFEVDYDRFRETRGLVAQWQHNYSEHRQATVYGQFSELSYPTQSIRDAKRSVLGVAYGQVLPGAYSPVVFGSAYIGREREDADGVPHLGHDLAGIRLGGRLRLATGWAAFANAAYENRDYGGPEPLFGVTREDRQYDVAVGVTYLLRPATTLVGQIAHTRNDSNIAINDFDRTISSVSVRFNF